MNTLSRAQRILALLFVVGCHVTLVVVVIPRLVSDVGTVQYPFTEGVVTVSEPQDLPLSKMNYWKLEYTYTVDGRTYTGTRYSFAGDDRYFRDDLLRILAEFPIGGRVPVAYNPDDPADAALRPAQPGHIFEWVGILLAGTVVAFLAVVTIFFAKGAPRVFDPDSERCIAQTREGLLVRLPPTFVIHPTVTFTVVFGLIVLVIFLRPTGHDPYPWWAGFLIVVCAPTLVIAMLALTRHSTLLVDEDRQRLLFTPGWPWANVALAFSDVTDIRVTPLTTKMQNGTTSTLCYRVMLTHTARGSPCDLTVCDYFNRDDADALVAWLRDRLGAAVPAELPLG